MRIFRAPRRRHHVGYGFGNIFSSIGRFVKPLLKSAVSAARPALKRTLKDLGKEGLKAAGSTAFDVLSGEPPKKALKKNIRRAAGGAKKTLKAGMKRGASDIHQAIKRKQTGSGVKRRRRIVKKGKKKKSNRKTKRKTRKTKHQTRRRRLPYGGIFS